MFRQDYHWWWRSFLTSGCTAFYLFGYCVHYFLTKLEIEGAASTFLYLGYTSVMVFLFFLLTGKCKDDIYFNETNLNEERVWVAKNSIFSLDDFGFF